MSRNKKIISVAVLLCQIFLPAVALAAGPQNFSQLANFFVNILDNATAVAIVLGIVIYFYGISTNILKASKGETSDLRSYLVWGVGILFIMVSIWGILKLLQNTLFSGTGYNGSGSSGASSNCDSFGSCSFGSE